VIITRETRLEEAHKRLQHAQSRIRRLREEEQLAISRRDYASATMAATGRMLNEQVYQQAYAVIVRGGKK
jgi:hypothetical protein